MLINASCKTFDTFTPAFIYDTRDGSEHSFLVYVPDMDIFTEGDDFTDAIEMARDAIGVAGISMEDNNEKLPMPSTEAKAIEMAKKNSDIVDFSQGILTYVDVDFFYYRRQIDMTTVRRNQHQNKSKFLVKNQQYHYFF